MPLSNRCTPALLLTGVLALQACATSSALHVARDQFRHGSTSDALQTLSEADVSRRDRLLLYMDRGLVAQAAGRYQDSIVALERAATLIDEMDYVSVRDQTASVITSDWASRYGGEYSERLWIHTFQMINFLMLDAPQSAAVEARRAVALYEQFGEVLKQDRFSRSLMALSFMAAGQRDSAMVEYRKLAEDFDISLPEPLGRQQGELVLFIASGFIEPKLPGDLIIDINARISFPFYPESFENPPAVRILEGSHVLPVERVDTPLSRISSTALAARGKTIAARHALRLTAKYGIAEAINREDELAGSIARLLLLAIEQADTRSWETLPAYLTLVRIPLASGKHTLILQVEDIDGLSGGVRQQREIELEVEPGQRQYRLLRLGINPD
ncbi:MAG: hypothetical protein HKN42_00840 [Granulosicoccus sp.]|nr:hypothetical protein [Granulosicoccus sp.]